MNGLTAIIEDKLSHKIKLHECKVISLGCGIGITESNFKCDSIDGVDIFDYRLNHFLKNWNAVKGNFTIGDIRKIDKIVKEKSYDVVLNLDVIEHLEKEEGWKLIKDAESIATKAVVFYTPIKWDTNEKATTDKTLWNYGNNYNLHKSLWTVREFMDKGYEVFLEYPNWTSPEGLIAIKVFK